MHCREGCRAPDAAQRSSRCAAKPGPIVRQAWVPALRSSAYALRRVRDTRALDPKMLAQLQALRLIVRADALAVQRLGPRQHFLVDQPADDLAVLQDERHFARANFQHRARALPAGAGVSKTGIEEAGI